MVKCKRLSTEKRLFYTDCLQDVDAGYLAKVDLDDKVSLITDEYNFHKALYDAVINHSLKIFSKCQRY